MSGKRGFRRGATWMEYVIIAVLVAAAIILAVLFFGRDIMNTFGVAGQATTGASSEACRAQSMQENRDGQTAAERACKSFDSQERDAARTSVRSAEVDIPLSDDDRGRERNAVK